MGAGDTPVIIGVAQQTWRERDAARSPVDALEVVARGALLDTGITGGLAIDALATVPFVMSQVAGLEAGAPPGAAAALCARLGCGASLYGADVGGNLPQAMINHLASALVEGHHRVALIAGAEMLNTFLGGLKRGEGMPDWRTGADEAPSQIATTPAMSAPSEEAHGIWEPSAAYPIFDTAWRHASGMSVEAHRRHLGEMISRMSVVSAANPHAWRQETLTAEQAVSTDNGNRLICYPYTKCMNAIISVDMAAAVVLTTLATARELGVPEEKIIYLRGAADAHDSWILSERKYLHRAPALEAAAGAALAQSGLTLDDMQLFDIYSCFPSAVQIACDAIGLASDDPRGVTVTGGLTLFGGPGNNYSLHAIATMVEQLRARGKGNGLLTANGGYLTKHSVGVYSTDAPKGRWSPPDCDALQATLDALERPVLVARGEGDMIIEGYTVRFQGAEPVTGIVLGRLADGSRCLAHTEARAEVFAQLMADDAVGLQGRVQPEETINRFWF
jgi:acetyl-CoA C-acetyltransferase